MASILELSNPATQVPARLFEVDHEKNRYHCLFWVLFFAAATLFCHFDYLRMGRVWAEEAIAISRAYSASLAKIPAMDVLGIPGTGYLQLGNNLTTLLMRWFVPLRFAPLFLQLYAVFFQTLPLFLLFLYRKELLLRPFDFMMASLLMLLTVQQFEIVMATTGLQFALSLSAAVILILPTKWDLRALGTLGILLVAGLTGVPSLCLLPLYFLVLMVEKKPVRLLQFLILLACAVIQFQYVRGAGLGMRQFRPTADGFTAAFMAKFFLVPWFGKTFGWESLQTPLMNGGLRLGQRVLLYFGTLGTLLALICYVARSRRTAPILLLASALVISIVSILGSLEGIKLVDYMGGTRYFYAPNILTALAVLLALREMRWPLRSAGIGLLAWILLIGIHRFNYLPKRVFLPETSWFDEVKAWKAKPSLPISIAPSLWELRLNQTVSSLSPRDQDVRFTLPFAGGVRLAQRFRTDADRLQGLSVRLDTGGVTGTAPIAWQLYEIGSEKRLRAEGRAEVQGHSRRLLELEFPPLAGSENRIFELELSEAHPTGLAIPLYLEDERQERLFSASTVGFNLPEKHLSAHLELVYQTGSGFVGLRY